ncbi:MAG: carbohydrate kinase [Candidatus Brocadiaceae bacterium]|nr:carbohydrate kinase [Candidatus Brocadiaceae bacterium]
MTQDRLRELTDRFPSLRIAVIGDFFLDKYLDCDPRIAEKSVESGRTAHQVMRVRHSPGAAGTVVQNLAALDAGALHAVGFTGDDGEACDLRKDLHALGCSTDLLLTAPDRMTMQYLKPRNLTDATLAGEHERYDTKNRTATPAELEDRIIAAFDRALARADAVIVADQVEADDCGAVTARVRAALSERARAHPGVVFFADSRTHIGRFRGLIIKPNQFEVAGVAQPLPGMEVDADTLRAGLRRLRDEVGAPVIATRGEKGAIVTDPEPTVVPGVRVDGPTDTTGAGDSMTAGCVLALAAGASLPEAALVGCLVASITIQQLATTGTARRDELPDRLGLWLTQQQEAQP